MTYNILAENTIIKNGIDVSSFILKEYTTLSTGDIYLDLRYNKNDCIKVAACKVVSIFNGGHRVLCKSYSEFLKNKKFDDSNKPQTVFNKMHYSYSHVYIVNKNTILKKISYKKVVSLLTLCVATYYLLNKINNGRE